MDDNWKCYRCNSLNHHRRIQCWKCGATRGESVAHVIPNNDPIDRESKANKKRDFAIRVALGALVGTFIASIFAGFVIWIIISKPHDSRTIIPASSTSTIDAISNTTPICGTPTPKSNEQVFVDDVTGFGFVMPLDWIINTYDRDITGSSIKIQSSFNGEDFASAGYDTLCDIAFYNDLSFRVENMVSDFRTSLDSAGIKIISEDSISTCNLKTSPLFLFYAEQTNLYAVVFYFENEELKLSGGFFCYISGDPNRSPHKTIAQSLYLGK